MTLNSPPKGHLFTVLWNHIQFLVPLTMTVINKIDPLASSQPFQSQSFKMILVLRFLYSALVCLVPFSPHALLQWSFLPFLPLLLPQTHLHGAPRATNCSSHSASPLINMILKRLYYARDRLHRLWGSVPNENLGPLVQSLLRISRWWQQTIKPRGGPFYVRGPRSGS